MTATVQEAPQVVPDNPFTYGSAAATKGIVMEWLEYQSTYTVPTAPSVGERRNVVKVQPMRLDAVFEHFPKVLQLFRRCQHFENECQRLQEQVAALSEVRNWESEQNTAETVSEGGKRGRRQRE